MEEEIAAAEVLTGEVGVVTTGHGRGDLVVEEVMDLVVEGEEGLVEEGVSVEGTTTMAGQEAAEEEEDLAVSEVLHATIRIKQVL